MPRVGARWAMVLLLLGGCESDRAKAERESALRQAELYGEAATQAADRSARSLDSLLVVELKNERETRDALRSNVARGEKLLADAGKATDPNTTRERDALATNRERLTESERAYQTKRRKLESKQKELLELKQATQALLDRPADGGPSPKALRDRLAGIEQVLAAAAAELSRDGDAGASP